MAQWTLDGQDQRCMTKRRRAGRRAPFRRLLFRPCVAAVVRSAN
jgi:hypothetical protein